MPSRRLYVGIAMAVLLAIPHPLPGAESLALRLRSREELDGAPGRFQIIERTESWQPRETAVIICDVWDYHHCLNAVRRLEEFAPRLNQVLHRARELGATIIHSPSDCMPAYEDHPARRRAQSAPIAPNPPADIDLWCSRIPAEERALYPIDQSDGGEDDDPAEHAQWVAKLKSLGRNPQMPWQRQSDMITIDADRDFISDRGDEVWNVLESRGIRNVILTGVHTNMCVLGRPFGLRQMVRGKKNVVLMRDMTDCMYNPARWPFVSHYEGNDLIIAHVERFVCPTITSDQLLGGKPFQFKGDARPRPVSPVDGGIGAGPSTESTQPGATTSDWSRHWTSVPVPATLTDASRGALADYQGPAWYRAVARIAKSPADAPLTLHVPLPVNSVQAWWNGRALESPDGTTKTAAFRIPTQAIERGDANLIVLRVTVASGRQGLIAAPHLSSPQGDLSLAGRWQLRVGDDPSWSNMPLPAKFGAATDIIFNATP